MQKYVINVESVCMRVVGFSAQTNTTTHVDGFAENVEQKTCLQTVLVIHAEQRKVVGFKI